MVIELLLSGALAFSYSESARLISVSPACVLPNDVAWSTVPSGWDKLEVVVVFGDIVCARNADAQECVLVVSEKAVASVEKGTEFYIQACAQGTRKARAERKENSGPASSRGWAITAHKLAGARCFCGG